MLCSNCYHRKNSCISKRTNQWKVQLWYLFFKLLDFHTAWFLNCLILNCLIFQTAWFLSSFSQWKLDMLMTDSWDWKSHQHFKLSPAYRCRCHQHHCSRLYIIGHESSHDCEISGFLTFCRIFEAFLPTWLTINDL